MLDFFEEYNIDTKHFTNGSHNKSVDGTGVLPSVDERVSNMFGDFIKNHLDKKNNITHLDIGGGRCWLSKGLDESGSFDSYSFEGSITLLPYIVHNHKKVAIVDLSKEITDLRLHRVFDVTTSFEVIEHVHRDDQLQFWKNISYLSKYHICSIHVMNEEHPAHCTINKSSVWNRIFEELGIKYKIIDNIVPEWDCSVSYFLTLPEKITNTSNFR